MSLLGGGSLLYTPPVPALARYEPTGTWMIVTDNWVAFSRDGINWDKAEYTGNTFEDAISQWVYATGKMVIPASDIVTNAYRMTNTNPVEFTVSTPAPNPGANDKFDPAFRLSHGTGGFSATSIGVIRSSGDADNWLEELPVPADFADSGLGSQTFMPEVGLHIRLGAGEFPTSPGTYWTSGNGTAWTERVFPEFFGVTLNDTGVLVGNGDDVIVVGLYNGRIYRSLDGVTWSLRFNPFPEQNVTSMVWNPQAFNGTGAFFAVMSGAPPGPGNLLTSPDGIFWTPVDPNDLTLNGQIAADTGKNLMMVRSGSANGEPEFANGGAHVSDDDGETWFELADRDGAFFGFIPAKIGPVVDLTVSIDTGAIAISDTSASAARATLALNAFTDLESNAITAFTIGAGTVALGKWAATLDTLNPFYYQVRLDRISGDDFVGLSASPIDEWIDFAVLWGYLLTSPPETKSFTGTLRIREKETLIESNSVSVSIDCEVTV